jgi:hypothetical protein
VKLISSVSGAVLALALGAVALPAAATTVVTIPNPPPGTFFWQLGQGDVSVSYSGVTFTQSALLGDAKLDIVTIPNVPSPAVLSSQQAPSGVENILITLPSKTKTFSLLYGTIDGSDVSFQLSNGASFTQASVGSSSGYDATELFQTTQSTPFNTVLVTSKDLILNVNDITFAAVPEPATWATMIIGFGMLGLVARRRKATAGAVC